MSSNTIIARDVSRDRSYSGNCMICGPIRAASQPTAAHVIEITPEGQYAGGIFLCQEHWQQALRFIAAPANWPKWAQQLIH